MIKDNIAVSEEQSHNCKKIIFQDMKKPIVFSHTCNYTMKKIFDDVGNKAIARIF